MVSAVVLVLGALDQGSVEVCHVGQASLLGGRVLAEADTELVLLV